MPRTGSIVSGLITATVAAGSILTPAVAAQEAPDTAVSEGRARSILPEPAISPRSAFLRSIALPGWGHASLGSYNRGAFYFGTQAATVWMLLTVDRRRGAAERVRQVRADEVEAQARLEGITDPFQIEQRVDADPSVARAQGLVESRDDQFEDWLALSLFLVLLGGADAYVSAHLSGFPAPVDIDSRMLARDRVEIGLSIPVGPPNPR